MKRQIILIGAGLAVSTAAALGACSSDEQPQTTGGNNATTGGPCAPTDPSCPALAVDSECLALVDNTDKSQFALRMSQLSIQAPTALTDPTVYQLVGAGVNVNLPTCNVSGDGTFSWITHFNTDTGKLKTGGAKPEANPSDGYCFDYDSDNGIAPVEVDSNLQADGTFNTAAIPAVVVPIYLDLDASSAVYLPLQQVQLTNGQISADQNCIGKFNAAGLEPINNCKPDLEAGIEYFLNAASLEGFISLEEADAVMVDLLQQSLCVLLSGDAATYGDDSTPKKCKRDADGKISLEGDWCSTTNSADGCKDAFRLEATLAASAVKLRDNCPDVLSGGAGGSGGSSSSDGGAAAGGAGNGGSNNGGAGGN